MYICASHLGMQSARPQGARHVFKMASLAVTGMLSSNLECTKRQRSGQVYHIVLPNKAYCSSRSLCSLCVNRDISAING